MRQVLSGFLAVALVAALGSTAFAKPATVTGKVVDEGCSTMDKNMAKGHAMDKGHDTAKDHGAGAAAGHAMPEDMTECAIMCAKNGEPLALLTDDGKVYRITGGLAANKNAKLIEHVGHTVSITGDVSEKDGKVMIASDVLTMVKK